MNYRQIAIQAGWELKEFSPGVFKWWNPKNDNGSRYLDKDSSLLNLCIDNSLDVLKARPAIPELSFDGVGINGPNEYRDRLATFNRGGVWSPAQIKYYGALFQAAPELLSLAEAIREFDGTAQAMRDLREDATAIVRKVTGVAAP